MSIEKYNPATLKDGIIAMNSSEERIINSSSKGSEDTPFSFSEYLSMLQNGKWEGGYVVLATGAEPKYIGKDDFYIGATNPEYAQYGSDVYTLYYNGSDSNSVFDLDKYMNSVFSFMNVESSDSSSSSSDNDSNEDNTESTQNGYTVYTEECNINGLFYIFEIISNKTNNYINIKLTCNCSAAQIPTITCKVSSDIDEISKVLFDSSSLNGQIKYNAKMIASFGYDRKISRATLCFSIQNHNIYTKTFS